MEHTSSKDIYETPGCCVTVSEYPLSKEVLVEICFLTNTPTAECFANVYELITKELKLPKDHCVSIVYPKNRPSIVERPNSYNLYRSKDTWRKIECSPQKD